MKIIKFIIPLGIVILGLVLFITVFFGEEEVQNNEFSFGVIADCQYCDVKGEGVRKYSLSESKLEKCINHLNNLKLEYVVHLGDFIDRDIQSYEIVNPIYEKLQVPKYHVLGNHDFSVADDKKNDVPSIMGMEARYYDFKVNGWRFIVLDGNDISFHAHPMGSKKYKEAMDYYSINNIESPKWNGAIGTEQISWLKSILDNSDSQKESIILYCHFPIYPENIHNLWNAEEIITLIESYPSVKAYINGHNHEGNYSIKEGIHYITMKGMVDTEITSYAVINIIEDKIKVDGYGREENRMLEIRK